MTPESLLFMLKIEFDFLETSESGYGNKGELMNLLVDAMEK